MPFSIYSPISTTNPLPVDLGAVTPAQLVPGETEYAVGDLLYADTTSTLALLPASTNGYYLKTGGAGTPPVWAAVTGAGVGDVSFNGAAPADNAVTRFDSTTGGLIQKSGCTIDDSDNLVCPGTGAHTFGTTNTVTLQAGAVTATSNILTGGATAGTWTGDNVTIGVKGSMANGVGIFRAQSKGTTNATAIEMFAGDTVAYAGHYIPGTATSYYLTIGAVDAIRVAPVTGNIAFAGSVETAAPNGGTAAAWKFGVKVDATTTLDTAKYLQVDVGGTLYKVALVTS